jgi:hypothetical protein
LLLQPLPFSFEGNFASCDRNFPFWRSGMI